MFFNINAICLLIVFNFFKPELAPTIAENALKKFKGNNALITPMLAGLN